MAVDIPTGVDADSGRVLGPAFRADTTVCMGFPKLGAFVYPGADLAGHVELAGLGIDPALAAGIEISIRTDTEIAALLPVRSPEGNKGSSGRLLSIGGSADFVGAPMLVAMAAYRIGAGLVEVAIASSIRDAVSAHGLEPVYRRLPESDGHIAPSAAESLAEVAGRAQAVAIGPGMGLSHGTVEFMRRLMPALKEAKARAVLVDADGLNALAQIGRWWETDLSRILTPHPGEMARLSGLSIEQIQRDRIAVAREFADRWSSVVLLKGAGTVIAEPGGEVTINTTGGPNLATAGTGDVLSGIIGGLLAQGCAPYAAGVAGAYIHGRSGDMARARRGDTGTVASDLLDLIPQARGSLDATSPSAGKE
jgi:NAD(P)H-hydrate epimerase